MSEARVTRARTDLRALTAARVALPMSGHSVATTELLGFQLAHARARYAVHAEFDVVAFARRTREEIPMLTERGVEVLTLRSGAKDRASYLRHPGLGRMLDVASAEMLTPCGCDVMVTVTDGLSTLAVERYAIPLLARLLQRVMEEGWTLGPMTVVQQGRVAVGDAIGERLGARCGLMLIGERPGLSAADSMGAYLTWEPRVGRTDAERNCLSNIRDGGLDVTEAAERLLALMRAARAMRLTGVALKEGAEGLLQEG